MGPFASSAYGPLPILGPYSPYPQPPPPEPLGPKVLPQVKRLGKMSLWLVPAGVIASMAIANEPAMAQAASNWKYGVAARLDDGIKQLLPQITRASQNGWIAADQQEFERVVALFSREIGALRGALGEIAGVLDEVAAGYRSYWVRLAVLASLTVSLLLFAKRLKAFPHTKFWGGMLEAAIAAGANGSVAAMTLILGSSLQGALDNVMTMVRRQHQFGYVLPSGAAAVDFTQATIDVSRYPSFRAPAKPGELPPGYNQFDWVEPLQKKAEPRTP
ncbi:WXG100 family type VII secretion target [Nonomuraea rhodomycinica]|uniref:Uncharacterized protein n=1 Tax=Nonomuraea rhodomycinica TaxID=1712872 RepID=A0A7Y6IME2_9ACTN|nr:hypothetical protein [Nonomuraea rhodomycinica]NUW40949.1 hypothetical protein [Nonomuraea rhodomycinica]